MSSSLKYTPAFQMMQMVNDYFEFVKGEQSPDTATDITKSKKNWVREPEMPTLRGVALFLGFCSIADFEECEQSGKLKKPLAYARLRIEAVYEQQLFEKPTGAIFALKSMGWSDKPVIKKTSAESSKTLKVEITTTGPKPASSEKEVDILI